MRNISASLTKEQIRKPVELVRAGMGFCARFRRGNYAVAHDLNKKGINE